MADDKQVIIPPLHDRPGNLMRKMAVLERYIQDLKNTQEYYGWIFTRDPWFTERIREAEAKYAELQEAFDKATAGIPPA